MLKDNVRRLVVVILTLVLGLLLIVAGVSGVDHLIGWLPREYQAIIVVAVLTTLLLEWVRELGARLRTLEAENERLQRRVRDLDRIVLKLDQKDGP